MAMETQNTNFSLNQIRARGKQTETRTKRVTNTKSYSNKKDKAWGDPEFRDSSAEESKSANLLMSRICSKPPLVPTFILELLQWIGLDTLLLAEAYVTL